jgi:phosphate transport system substrate-binding protein
VALVVVLGLAGCASDPPTPEAGAPAVGTSDGDIEVSGSSTVAPISAFVADEFNFNGSPAQISVDDPGTGDGFALFCEGAIDVAGASRPIKDEEIEACDAKGISFVELEVALDGITVLTSAENRRIDCLTFADLYALLGPEADGVDRWDDATELAHELGSDTDLPDIPLDVTAPGTESGTYDAFIELALGDLAELRVEEGAVAEEDAESMRPDYSSQADDNAIISGIEGSPGSLGFVGFAFAEGAGDGVRELAIDGGDGCVEPSAEAIADGSYPISRSLYVYVNAAAAEENEALAEYVDFFLTDISLETLVAEAGYVPLPAERVEATRERWRSRSTGAASAETTTVTA